MYNIELYAPAAKALGNLSEQDKSLVEDELVEVAQHRNPISHRNVKKLDTEPDIYRLRRQDLRIIFGVASTELLVLQVGKRTDRTYENLDHLESVWEQAMATA